MRKSAESCGEPDLLGSLWVTNPIVAHERWRSQAQWDTKGKLLVGPQPDGAETVTRYSRSTLKQDHSRWKRFCKWLLKKKLDVIRVQEANISAFLASLEGNGGRRMKPSTVCSYKKEINRVFHWLEVYEQIISLNPVKDALKSYRKIPRFNLELPPRGILTHYEAAAEALFQTDLKEHPGDWVPIRNLAIRLIAFECALKPDELCKLTSQDIGYLPNGTIKIYAPGHGPLNPRTLIGSARLSQVIESWMAQRRTKRIRNRRARDVDGSGKGVNTDEIVRLFLGKPCKEITGEVAYPTLSSVRILGLIVECMRAAFHRAGAGASSNCLRDIQTAFVVRLIFEGVSDHVIQYRTSLASRSPIAKIRDAIARKRFSSDLLFSSHSANARE